LQILILDKTPPEAIIGLTYLTVAQGDIVELDGGDSTDNSGRIAEYAWDIDSGDGANFEETDYRQKSVSFVAAVTTTVTLQVKDATGNEATTTAEIEVIDNTPPEPPQFNPLTEEGLPVTVGSFTLTGVAEPEALVSVVLEGTNSQQQETIADKEGNFGVALSGLTDGRYNILGTASDTAGNVSPQSQSIELVIDTTPPQVGVGFEASSSPNRQPDRDRAFGVLLEPVQTNRLQPVGLIAETANSVPSVPVQISDDGGLDTVEFVLLEGSTPVSLAGGASRNADGATTFSDTITPLRDLINGVSYLVQVTAVDQAKLESTAEFQFKINLALADATPPQISFVLPDTDGMITA
jgi:PKD repeat protein